MCTEHGDFYGAEGEVRPLEGVCLRPYCEQRHYARGYCQRHYFQLRRDEAWQKRGNTGRGFKDQVEVKDEPQTATKLCGFVAAGCACSRPRYAKDLCSAHYKQLRLGETLRPLRERGGQAVGDLRFGPLSGCMVEGCVEKHRAKGYCAKHRRWLKEGKLNAPQEADYVSVPS